MLFIKGHGGGMASRRESITPDLWIEMDLGFDTPCWIWRLGPKNRKTGHCNVWISGREYSAHRTVYETYVGPIPEGLVLDHLCKNPRCVNPDHMEPVTQAENVRRSPATKLAKEDVIFIRTSSLGPQILAEKFGVHRAHIHAIRRHVSWKDV